jgi:hypothetical protein
MFALGISEPITSNAHLEKQSIVWNGGVRGESSRGYATEHPICELVSTIIVAFDSRGSWNLCERIDSQSPECKRLRARLSGADWVVTVDKSECTCAHRPISGDSPWPYPKSPGLPYRPREILLVGSAAHMPIACATPSSVPPLSAEDLILTQTVTEHLIQRECYAIFFGWTHTENRPGISIIGKPGLDPRRFVPKTMIHSVHFGIEAGWAWSQAVIDSQ